MAKLTDRQRKRIVAEYVNGDGKISQQQLADKYGVSRQAISKILATTEGCERLQQKKEQNTQSMLEYLDGQKDRAQSLIDKILSSAVDDIAKAPLRDKMGALKILTEVFASKQDNALAGNNRIQITFAVEDTSGGDNTDTSVDT